MEARMELEAGGTVEEMEMQKDRTACAGSCCLDAGGVELKLCLTPCQADRPP